MKKLKAQKRWVAYKAEKDETNPDRVKKIPVNPRTGYGAKANDADTWSSYETALQYAETHGLAGIGFELGGGFAGIDLDHVIQADGTIEDTAAEIVDFMDSYTEYSPSGTGLHIVFTVDDTEKEWRDFLGGTLGKKKESKELYFGEHYLTVTEKVYKNHTTVENRTQKAKEFYLKYLKKEEKKILSDNEILEKMFSSKNGYALQRLYDGDISAYGGDESSADLALCNYLAFWTGKDLSQMDRLFRSSGLMREKWDRPTGGSTYGLITLNKAIADTTAIYEQLTTTAKDKEISTGDKFDPAPIFEFVFDLYANEDEKIADKKLADFCSSLDDEIMPHAIPVIKNARAMALKGKKQNQNQFVAMREKFLENRDIFFTGSVKGGAYYEYNQSLGIWQEKPDAVLRSEIAEFFNYELKNHAVSEILISVRDKVTRYEKTDFNMSEKLAFSNGTLDLLSGELQGHSKDNFLSRRLDYAYDKKADCPTWLDFLSDITCGDSQKANLLEEIAGYILFSSCPAQKMFFLLGNGSNGKSTYLKILESLFGDSVTNIQPCDFNNPTERVGLQHSFVNICADIDPDLRGTEPFFKAISGGETIRGNRKFQDSFDFKTRAKIISSCNENPRFKSFNKSIQRRLVIVYFGANFDDDSGNADAGLPEKLYTERSGIFNRIYKQYKKLKQNHCKFTKTVDQNLILEIAEENNPVFAFWNENQERLLSQGKVDKTRLYQEYQAFCEKKNNGYMLSFIFFIRAMNAVLKEQNIAFEERRIQENGKQNSTYFFLSESEKKIEKAIAAMSFDK